MTNEAATVYHTFDRGLGNVANLLAEGAVVRGADRARAAQIRAGTARLREARLSRLEAVAVAAVDRRQAQERRDLQMRLRAIAASRA